MVKPKTNPDFWEEKRSRTVARDAKNCRDLESHGWRVITIWECETKSGGKLAEKLARLFSKPTL
jgi:DNA mismatch endonuclease, patch repair protein